MISKRIYFTIVILMLMVFVMFMFAQVSATILSDASENNRGKETIGINHKDILTADSFNLDYRPESKDTVKGDADMEGRRKVAVLSGKADDQGAKLLIQWCVYQKYFYKLYTAWPEKEELEDYDVILFGNYDISAGDYKFLYSYAELGKTMIFTQLPDYQVIRADKDLADFYGIESGLQEQVTADGIRIFPEFMIGEERNYLKGDFYGNQDDTAVTIPYYKLRAGYEVYAIGVLDSREELGIKYKELPPLLWRTKTDQAFVFVVNSEIFQGLSMLGVLTAFMTHESELYLYPIVNAQTISILNYPYFSDENSETMQQLYSRTSEAVARDLLWPNIVQILKNYGSSYSFFAAPQFDYSDEVGPKGDDIEFYLREIGKLPGDMGLSLERVTGTGLMDIISTDQLFFDKAVPDYDFTALYTAKFSDDEVLQGLQHDFLKDISLVMSDYNEGDNFIGMINDDVLSVKFNLDGFQHETRDDLRMSFMENALGVCNVKVDMGRVFYPEDNTDEWNYLSMLWSKGDTYFKSFSKLDMVSIYEMEKRIRRFLALDYAYEYDENQVQIRIKQFDKEAYFILRANSKSIDKVENGTAEEIATDTYLIKATDENVKLYLLEENVLKKPRNNKIITIYPEEAD